MNVNERCFMLTIRRIPGRAPCRGGMPGAGKLSQSNATRLTPSPLPTRSTEVDRVDVVKIDVEGAELQVLKGMERLLKEFLPIVILEVEPTLLEAFSTAAPDLWAFLAAKGYRAENIDSTNVMFTCPSTRRPTMANYQPPAGDASAPRLIRHAAQAVLD